MQETIFFKKKNHKKRALLLLEKMWVLIRNSHLVEGILTLLLELFVFCWPESFILLGAEDTLLIFGIPTLTAILIPISILSIFYGIQSCSKQQGDENKTPLLILLQIKVIISSLITILSITHWIEFGIQRTPPSVLFYLLVTIAIFECLFWNILYYLLMEKKNDTIKTK